MIDFTQRTKLDTELKYLKQWNNLTAGGVRRDCCDYFVNNFRYPNFFLTKSCSQSLELAMLILDLPPESEVILPSYAFLALANAVALRNLKCVFVDCEKETMNIDVNAVESAISEKTRAIITLNYGGVACDYDKIHAICKKHNLILIEDNAHGIRAKYKDQWLGSMGDISTISFDSLKNITCVEGGGIVINNTEFFDRFKTAYLMGSNKNDFDEGKALFYEWKGLGSNHVLAEPLAYILLAQLTESEMIVNSFQKKWKTYYNFLKPLEDRDFIELAKVPSYSQHNGHIFWIKTADLEERSELINFLRNHRITCAFHYSPLHTSEYGKKVGLFRGEDLNTTIESSRLIRLPIYHALGEDEISYVVSKIFEFYHTPFTEKDA